MFDLVFRKTQNQEATMTTESPETLDHDTIELLQANLDAAVTDREFVGDWQEPWPSIRVSELGEHPVSTKVPGTKTKLKFELSYGTIRVEAENPYLGIELVRLVTPASPGNPGRIYCGC